MTKVSGRTGRVDYKCESRRVKLGRNVSGISSKLKSGSVPVLLVPVTVNTGTGE